MNKPQDNDLVSKLGKLLEAGDKDSLNLVYSVFESLTDTDQPKTNNTQQALQTFLYQRIPYFIELLKPPVPNNLIGHIGFLVKNIEFKDDYKRLFNFPKLPRYFEANPHTKPRLYLRLLHNNKEPFIISPNSEEKRPGYFHIAHFCKLPKIPKDQPITEKLVNQDGEVIVNDTLLEPFALSEKEKYFLLSEPNLREQVPYKVIISQLEGSSQSNLFQWFVVESVSLSDGCKIMIQHAGTPFKCQLTREQYLESPFHMCPACHMAYTTPELSFILDDSQPFSKLNLYHSSMTTQQAAQNLQNQQTYQQQSMFPQQSPIQYSNSPIQPVPQNIPCPCAQQGFPPNQNIPCPACAQLAQQYIQQTQQYSVGAKPETNQAMNIPQQQEQVQQQQQVEQQEQYQQLPQYSPPEDVNGQSYDVQDNQTNDQWNDDNDFDDLDTSFDF